MSTAKEMSEQPAKEVVSMPEPMKAEPQAPAPSTDDDELEIPAFLRRY